MHAVEYGHAALIAFDGIEGLPDGVLEQARRLASGAASTNLDASH